LLCRSQLHLEICEGECRSVRLLLILRLIGSLEHVQIRSLGQTGSRAGSLHRIGNPPLAVACQAAPQNERQAQLTARQPAELAAKTGQHARAFPRANQVAHLVRIVCQVV
jgi:hypothetical protein